MTSRQIRHFGIVQHCWAPYVPDMGLSQIKFAGVIPQTLVIAVGTSLIQCHPFLKNPAIPNRCNPVREGLLGFWTAHRVDQLSDRLRDSMILKLLSCPQAGGGKKRILRGVSGVSGVVPPHSAAGPNSSCITAILGPSGTLLTQALSAFCPHARCRP